MAQLLYHLTLESSNTKTGQIPVSTSSRDLCSITCPLRGNGCYAEQGPLRLHWDAVTNGIRGILWPEFLAAIRALPDRQLWRHNQAGDLRDPNLKQGRQALASLVEANRGKRGFTYTHHRLKPAAIQAVKAATAHGFTVNVSTESETAADIAMSKGLRAVFIVASDDKRRIWRTQDGNVAITCPAQLRDGMTCERCKLCQSRPQHVAIAFRAHGTQIGRAHV